MDIKVIGRDANGLVSGVNYVQDAEGLIDWRKMIDPKFLVPNKRLFEKYQKPIPETVEGLQDNELLILLGGIKRLARLRGFTKVQYALSSPSSDYVAAICQIEWIPNFETEGRTIVSGGMADAHPNNTDGFGKMFLAAIAENRAFVRCVRSFLGVNIIGQDEVGDKNGVDVLSGGAPVPAQTSPTALLEQLMQEKSVSFDEIKAKLVAEQVDRAAEMNSVSDIPKLTVFSLVERLRKKKTKV